MSSLKHLHRLEAESVDIMREAVSESERPALLYAIVDSPLGVAEMRDAKGLYKKARRGEWRNFIGIGR